MSPLAGQMFFRASLFGAFGESKRWLATNADGTTRGLRTADYYKAGAITGFIAAFTGEAALHSSVRHFEAVQLPRSGAQLMHTNTMR